MKVRISACAFRSACPKVRISACAFRSACPKVRISSCAFRSACAKVRISGFVLGVHVLVYCSTVRISAGSRYLCIFRFAYTPCFLANHVIPRLLEQLNSNIRCSRFIYVFT